MLILADGRHISLSCPASPRSEPWRVMTHFLVDSLVLTTTAASVAVLAAWAGRSSSLVGVWPPDSRVSLSCESGPGERGAFVVVVFVSSSGDHLAGAVPAFRIRRVGPCLFHSS